jgi:hypothetical protein
MQPARFAPLAARLRSVAPISDDALGALYPLASARSFEADA